VPRPRLVANAATHNGNGLEHLVDDPGALARALIVIETISGFEITVAPTVATADLPLAVVNPR
jgi:hypothetical protein